jgi:hypothetical protein
MPKKRVIAHSMHEREQQAAVAMMSNVVSTPGFVMGDVDEAQIKQMKRQGLVVQVLGDPPAPPVGAARARGARPRTPPMLGGRPSGAAPTAGPIEMYSVSFRGPLMAGWKAELSRLGVDLGDHLGGGTYTSRLTPAQAGELQQLPFVQRVEAHRDAPATVPRTTFLRRGGPSRGVRAGGGGGTSSYDILLENAATTPSLRAWLGQNRVAITQAGGRKIRVQLPDASPLVAQIKAQRGVVDITPFVPPKLHADVARALLGIQPKPAGATWLPLTGEGQVVAIADTGLDSQHPDFRGRIDQLVALGRPGDPSDPHGHGTHVAGCAVGDGTASQGRLRGVAPKARLFFQSLLDANHGLGGLPLELDTLFQPAYDAGARVHSNSWGSTTRSTYTVNSVEVDGFVATHRDMVIVFSAGNSGSAAANVKAKKGYVEWTSIDSPATCKNALVVGASRSSRTSGGYAGNTYRQRWETDFPDPPIAAEKVSGNPECLAAFSSRGPCDDYRIKPDVVAPGTDIASTRSATAPDSPFWGPFPGNPSYAFMGGTSMAAPLVSGCAALVREYYLKQRNHAPSAALVKATLINGTRWLTGRDARADFKEAPNYHQGFGCVYMPWTLPNPRSGLKLEFLDPWKDPATQLAETGDRFRWEIEVTGGEMLRVCLVWTDPPPRGLQNNLNLFLEGPPPRADASGRKWFGNEALPMGIGIPDTVNNVEIIRLTQPAAGRYIIQVTATSLLRGPQDFALVVTGKVRGGIKPYSFS